MKDKLELLVVEDNVENIAAAQAYFNTRDDVNVNFKMTFNDGLYELKSKNYDLGIFDLHLPKENGAEPEKLGLELAKEATKLCVPWAVITAGYHQHSKKDASFVLYFYKCIPDVPDIKEIEAKLQGQKALDKLLSCGFYVITNTKTDPNTWQEVYEKMNLFDNKIYWSLKRIDPKNPAKLLFYPIGKIALNALRLM